MPTEHKITVEKTAHYYTIGNPSPDIKYFWIVCHGYGQLAKKFIHKFEGLDDGQTFVLAPEGFSRFYWKRQPDIVGTSWMTKEDRLDEIADYTKYIKSLYDHYQPQLNESVQIILLGFSQGCATQCRWLMREFPAFDHLVLWAGLLPEDLDYKPYQDYFSTKKLHFFCGDEDQFINHKILEWHSNFAKAQALELITTMFKGKHEIDREELKKLAEDIQVVR